MRTLLLFLVVGVLAGCATAPQAPIGIAPDYFANGPKKIGVMIGELPETDVYLPGANCLLCLAVAETANSSLSTHVSTLKTDDLLVVKSELVQQLKAKGMNVVSIDEPVVIAKLPKLKSGGTNTPQRDFSAYGAQYEITHLVVIDIIRIGIQRNYSSYIPNGDPRAVLAGAGYLVDLESNTYDWYLPLEIYKSADGRWDEPPSFPALTNAYYQAVETGREKILSEF